MIEHVTGIPKERILILDFGSQYTQLIARRIRELNVYAEIIPYHHPVEDIIREKPSAIILSGGPASFYEKGSPKISDEIFKLGVPVLGICYGLYVVVNAYKGESGGAASREYGRAIINIKGKSELLKGLGRKSRSG
jgi:GMP synthase (glutamine-hydrolysing)